MSSTDGIYRAPDSGHGGERMHCAEQQDISRELESSEKRFRTLFEFSPDASFLYNTKGILLDGNRKAEEVTGYAREELIGKSLLLAGFLDNEDLARGAEIIQEGAKGNPTGPDELYLNLKDGTRVLVEIRTIPITIDNEPAVIGIAHDITERKRAEEALRESEEKYRLVVENASEAIAIVQDNKAKYFNPKVYELGGYEPNADYLDSFMDFIHPDDRQVIKDTYAMRLRGEPAPESYEIRILTKSGKIKWVEVRSRRINWEGKPAVLVFMTEVTERKKAEEDLRKSEERFRSLAEISSDFIWETDEDGRIIFVGRRIKDLTGLEADEMIGKAVLDLVPTEEPVSLERFLEDNRRTYREFRNIEIHFHNKGGRRVFCEASGVPVIDADGVFQGYRGVARDITERRQSEDALRESERRLRTQLDYILSTDSETKEIGLTDLVNLEDLQRIQDSFAEVTGLASIITDVDSNLITAPSNFNKVCEIIGKTQRGAEQCDISDKQRTARARESRKPFYQQCSCCGFVDASAPIIVDGKHVANWLIGQCNAMGVERERLEESAREVGADAGEVLAAFDSMPSITPAEFESALNLLWLMAKEISTIGYNNLKLARDVAELKSAEEALRAGEEKYRTLVENLNEGIWTIDRDGNTSFVNSHMAEILGYSEEEMMGRHLFSFMDETEIEHCSQLMKRRENGISEKHDFKFLSKDGKTVITKLTASPIFDEDGEYAGSIAGVIDVTEQKQMEEQLNQANKMEAIGQLAGGIAHDFNNLLTGILGYSNLLKLQSEPESQVHDAAKTIEKAAERASELTQQLLGFARRGKHQVIPVDIHNTIHEAAALLNRTLDRNISILLDLRATDSHIPGDPVQMQQVLLNLGINARDAMPEGGELTIKTRNIKISEGNSHTRLGMAPGKYIVITVVDTGMGIENEIQGRIFEPFFTTKGFGEGTGMGLAMVYGIIKNHSGFIEVDSEPGNGATFEVILPLAAAMKIKPFAGSKDKPTRGTGCILLVDDEEIIRTVGAHLLRHLGYQVITASGGAEAVEVYRRKEEEIDLVIIDMVMPGMDGRECFLELRRINHGVKAILSTGYGLDGRAQETIDEGMQGFIQKPYQVSSLGEKIGGILGG